MGRLRLTVNDCPEHPIALQVADVKIEFVTFRGIHGETVSEGEEDSDITRVEAHYSSGGIRQRVGVPLATTTGLCPLL